MLSLSSARQLAASSIQKAQAKYKEQYDRKTKETMFRVGDWILVRFPQDESGRWRKLSRPWHGPYRILDKSDPNVTCIKVYYPQDGPVHVHQSRISRCPEEFPAGFYWYGNKRRGPGRPPKWVDRLLRSGPTDTSRKSVTTSRHGAQHAVIGDSPQRQDDLLQQSQHQDGCAPQVHSSPEDTPGTAQASHSGSVLILKILARVKSLCSPRRSGPQMTKTQKTLLPQALWTRPWNKSVLQIVELGRT